MIEWLFFIHKMADINKIPLVLNIWQLNTRIQPNLRRIIMQYMLFKLRELDYQNVSCDGYKVSAYNHDFWPNKVIECIDGFTLFFKDKYIHISHGIYSFTANKLRYENNEFRDADDRLYLLRHKYHSKDYLLWINGYGTIPFLNSNGEFEFKDAELNEHIDEYVSKNDLRVLDNYKIIE